MTVVKMGLVPTICQADAPVTADELAKSSGSEKLLIGKTVVKYPWPLQTLNMDAVRLMRPLTASGIFKETGVETYTSTRISQMLMAPPLIGGFQFMYGTPRTTTRAV